ncbi:peroxiredoxin family protein [Mangrovibacterium sp.]|uniref:peroxiredoxin family protein n=1 Tax=Mangrovibacterium sp. TaxID=1961364 RepID=UPI003568BD63
MKAWSLLFFILFTFLSFNLKAQKEPDESTLVRINQPAPNFSFSDQNGQTHTLNEFRGKVVLLTFFATWCGPCLKELAHLDKEIYEKYKDNPNFVLLVFGREHNQSELNDFKNKKAIQFNLLADPKREIYSKYATQFIPRNFIIGKDGKISYSSIGFDEDEFENLLNTLNENLK